MLGTLSLAKYRTGKLTKNDVVGIAFALTVRAPGVAQWLSVHRAADRTLEGRGP